MIIAIRLDTVVIKTIHILTRFALVPDLAAHGFTVKQVCGSGTEFNFLLSFADSSMSSLYLCWNDNNTHLVYHIALISKNLLLNTKTTKYVNNKYLFGLVLESSVKLSHMFPTASTKFGFCFKALAVDNMDEFIFSKLLEYTKLYPKSCNICFPTAKDWVVCVT